MFSKFKQFVHELTAPTTQEITPVEELKPKDYFLVRFPLMLAKPKLDPTKPSNCPDKVWERAKDMVLNKMASPWKVGTVIYRERTDDVVFEVDGDYPLDSEPSTLPLSENDHRKSYPSYSTSERTEPVKFKLDLAVVPRLPAKPVGVSDDLFTEALDALREAFNVGTRYAEVSYYPRQKELYLSFPEEEVHCF